MKSLIMLRISSTVALAVALAQCVAISHAAEPWDYKHWSFQPMRMQQLPEVKDKSWPRNRIDQFILAKLDAAGLRPAPRASEDVLRRRLWFDLVGLPPSDEDAEREDFSLIEKLLSSPHFGVRWARHWLDVARYAESSGNTRNMAYTEAWRYRNYVIRAFNDDRAFDQFIREQIAGDLLPWTTQDQRDQQLLGTGFLNVGVRTLGEQDLALYELNQADDLIDATCHAFLALSANCARCHDHKFDPIPARDYYALAGIFRSTRYLAGTQTNNRMETADIMPLGPDAEKRAQAVRDHVKKQDEMQAGYLKVVKLRNDEREALVKAGFDPSKGRKPEEIPDAMKPKIEALKAREKEIDGWQARLKAMQQNTPAPPPGGMACLEAEKPADCPLYDKGDVKKPLATVPRGVLSVLPVKLAPISARDSGRRQLSDWIASRDNPLTARVIVNRVWLKLMGRGLVDTPDDFGKLGSKPTHPELLDDLALRFIDNGWSVKWLVREIVGSAACQQISNLKSQISNPHAATLYAGATPKRLEAEPLRDAMLALGGGMDLSAVEGSQIAELAKPVKPQGREVGRGGFLNVLDEDISQRSIYLPVVRGSLTPTMQCFNAADPASIVGQRGGGIVPAQSLLLMNSNFVMRQAEGFAGRTAGIADAKQRARAIVRMAFGRDANANEAGTMVEFAMQAGWPQLCHVLFQSAEFQIVD